MLLEVEEIKFKMGGWSNVIVFIIPQMAFSDQLGNCTPTIPFKYIFIPTETSLMMTYYNILFVLVGYLKGVLGVPSEGVPGPFLSSLCSLSMC